MSEPIAFISHFTVKAGKRDDVTRLFQDVAECLKVGKPRTLVFLAYLNETGTQVSFLHVFADSEVSGRPSQQALETMRQAATSAGVTLSVERDYLGGFIRLSSR